MWATIGKYTLKFALWALNHPDQIKAGANIIKEVTKKESK